MKTLSFQTHQDIFDRAVAHLFEQKRAALLPRGGGAYRGYCGGCPVGSFIKLRDYMTAMEGIPVRYIAKPPGEVPRYMDVGVAALKKRCCGRASTSTTPPPLTCSAACRTSMTCSAPGNGASASTRSPVSSACPPSG